jgi:hypothetical protein
VLAVRAGEVAESRRRQRVAAPHHPGTAAADADILGAARPRRRYEQPPQYLSASVTGYEDLNYYARGPMIRSTAGLVCPVVLARLAPYTTGRWISDPTYGWTWVDEQPGASRLITTAAAAQRNNRWFWVPPERTQRALYAPRWFPSSAAPSSLASACKIVSPSAGSARAARGLCSLLHSNRDYYRRLNLTARVQDRASTDRW